MARESVTNSKLIFKTKAAAAGAAREIIARSAEGVPLKGDDLEFAVGLLRRHPQLEYKLRNGITGILVQRAPGFATRCFTIVRRDGQLEDFSWQVALGLKPAWPLLGDAGRRVILDGVLEFKRRALADGPVTCPILGETVTWEDAHVDHAPPHTFDEIVRALREVHGEPELRHESTRDVFVNPADAARFRAFHDARAQLRIVHRRANLSTLRTGLSARSCAPGVRCVH